MLQAPLEESQKRPVAEPLKRVTRVTRLTRLDSRRVRTPSLWNTCVLRRKLEQNSHASENFDMKPCVFMPNKTAKLRNCSLQAHAFSLSHKRKLLSD